MLALADPRWAELRHALGSAAATPLLLGEVRARPAERPLWRELEATLCPRGTTWSAGFASIPHLVDAASRLAPFARLRHVAVVGGVAFGRGRDADPLDPWLVEVAYRSATDTAKRVLLESADARVWEPWETQYLLAACAAVAGRLRRLAAAP